MFTVIRIAVFSAVLSVPALGLAGWGLSSAMSCGDDCGCSSCSCEDCTGDCGSGCPGC